MLVPPPPPNQAIDAELFDATDKRVDALACAFERGDSVQSICEKTKINPWFLCKLHSIHLLRKHLEKESMASLSTEELLLAKQQAD